MTFILLIGTHSTMYEYECKVQWWQSDFVVNEMTADTRFKVPGTKMMTMITMMTTYKDNCGYKWWLWLL
jgi:hypothetical protein